MRVIYSEFKSKNAINLIKNLEKNNNWKPTAYLYSGSFDKINFEADNECDFISTDKMRRGIFPKYENKNPVDKSILEKLAKYELEKLERELLEIERIETLIKNQNIRNAQLTDAEKKYILTIKAKIENNWLVPHDSRYDKICTVIVNQLPSGKVTNVKVHGCKGDSLYIDSLINAVWKSSPLPIAPDIEVFQENIVLQFEGQTK